MVSPSLDDLIKNYKKHQETLEGLKNIVGMDKMDKILKENLESINELQTILENISEKVNKNTADIAKDDSKSIKVKQTNTKTKGRSVWFALGAIGAIMTGTVLSNDPIALLENLSFQTIIGALVAYATGRQIFKHVKKE